MLDGLVVGGSNVGGALGKTSQPVPPEFKANLRRDNGGGGARGRSESSCTRNPNVIYGLMSQCLERAGHPMGPFAHGWTVTTFNQDDKKATRQLSTAFVSSSMERASLYFREIRT